MTGDLGPVGWKGDPPVTGLEGVVTPLHERCWSGFAYAGSWLTRDPTSHAQGVDGLVEHLDGQASVTTGA